MLRTLTKRLFGLKDPEQAPVSIIDGEFVATTPGHPSAVALGHTENQICDYTQIQKHGKTAEPADDDTQSLQPEPAAPMPCPASIPEQYLVHLGATGRARRTIQEYTWELQWWERQSSPITSLTLPMTEKIIHKMHPTTARRKIAALRSYAKWRLRDGDDRLFVTLSQVGTPRIPVRVPKDKGEKAFQELTARARELVAKEDRRGVWLGLMLCCGLRISEIKTAQVVPGGAIKVLGKGNKERMVPAPSWLLHIMALDESAILWRRGRKLIWSELKNLDLKKPHSLRHTYASELIRRGLDLEQIKALLGHAKLDTTLIYAKVKLPENLINKLGIE